MAFLAAGWLLALVPLAAIAWRLRRGADSSRDFTAGFLWPREIATSRASGRTRWPPSDARWLLLAASLAVVALARPVALRADRSDATAATRNTKADVGARDGSRAMPIADESDEVLQRVARAFTEARPGTTGVSIRLARGRPVAGRAIRFSASTRPASGPITLTAHPIVAASGGTMAPAVADEPPEGFATVAAVGGRPVVAIRESAGGRQVWLAVDLAAPTPETIALIDAAARWLASEPDGPRDTRAGPPARPAREAGVPLAPALDGLAAAALLLASRRVGANQGPASAS